MADLGGAVTGGRGTSPEGPANGAASGAGNVTGGAEGRPTALTVAGERLVPRPSGALHWPDRALLAVGDLHLGRSERLARQGGGLLPPYETVDTLNRLEDEILALSPRLVICLGDSFDDLPSGRAIADEISARIERLAAGRRWIWIAGNHDPGPVEVPGSHLAEVGLGPIAFRHIARAPGTLSPGEGEVSAHYHPKAALSLRGTRVRRPCFLSDGARVILPAFGTFTGGLDVRHPALAELMGRDAQAILIGRGSLTPVPVSALAT